MRTNIEIDEGLMAEAMKAGPYKTKKEAVEAGLKLLARQTAYREILKWRGKLKWEGDEAIDWVAANKAEASAVQEPAASYRVSRGAAAKALPTGKTTKASRARR